MRRQGLRFLAPICVLFIAASLCAQSAGTGVQVRPYSDSEAKDMLLKGDPHKQSAEAPSEPIVGAIFASEGIVKLDVTVTDQAGKSVFGLTPKDFTLLDNGLSQKIVTFRAFDGATVKPDPPVEVILVIDTLNLEPLQVNHVEQEVARFLRQDGGHLVQPVSIYKLSDGGLSVAPQPSTDGNALAEEMTQKNELHAILTQDSFEKAVAMPRQSIEGYRNQLSLTALGAMVLDERQKPGRKLMIWLGGGWPVLEGNDIDSFDWITEFSTRLREARIVLSSATSRPYPVRKSPYQDFLQGIKSASRVPTAYLIQSMALEVLATQSGGRVIEPEIDLADQIKQLVGEANAFYTISFDPPRTDQVDEAHDLKVELGNPALVARTNTGYYDEPAFYDQPPRATRQLTVEGLEQLLQPLHSQSDSAMAQELSGMELTERLSSAKLSELKERMPGSKSRAELVAIADASAFLNPPSVEVPNIAAPDPATQRLMLSKTVDYLAKSIPRLPNFFATRSTVRFRETGQNDDAIWKASAGDQRLHSEVISNATVLYRNGLDFVDAPAKGKKPKEAYRTMDTRGTFGPILGTVFLDAAHGAIRWSRWEQGDGGLRAVFRYSVPKAKSHYEVNDCCLTDGDGTRVFSFMPGYHGELIIDPESGAILRLTVEPDLEPRLPLERADIMVQYAPESIAGNTYICPARSVSFWRGRRNVRVNEWGRTFKVYGPFETMLDDVSFGDYHMFRGEAHVLTGYEPEIGGQPGDSGADTPPSAAPSK
jgi:VWFA-related protein